MYLMRDGRLAPEINKDCLFACEYHGGYIALRDQQGLYLSPIGSRAVLKTRSNVVTKDELFSLEDSLPQASFQAVSNQRFVSIKQGVDVTANQEEISNHETFQLEFDPKAAKWAIRTMQDKYFSLQAGGGLQAGETRRANAALLDLNWLEDGAVTFKADNGKFVGTNKAAYATIQVERAESGQVHLKGENGKYWQSADGGISCDSQLPQGFFLELREPTRMCIKNSNGQYLVEQKNGGFTIGTTDPEDATRWEY